MRALCLSLCLFALTTPAWGAEIVLERHTHCPTRPVCPPRDERVFEIVLDDDSPLEIKDTTLRVTNAVRVYSRGDLSVLRGRAREVLLTVGRDANRVIAMSLTVTNQHGELSLRGAGLTLEWYQDARRRRVKIRRNFDVRVHPPRPGPSPTPGQRFSDYMR